ncbi:GNAT family N-acetyltransferase [Streptomyces sp. NPDC086091]|uniref:GNAT family N-acetyltransferase n=1 Tax=Streptomyces sp. NPDC086091 TaxID=3365751 RepID=UPI00380FC242
MTDRSEVRVVDWPASGGGDRLSALLADYHLRTEAEKGEPVGGVDGLPDRYRAEVLDPAAAFAGHTVLVARVGDTAVGCLVVTRPADGDAEVKRLWTDPAFRGRGVASALLRAGVARAREAGARTVRLSVWEWRADAVALYRRLGFTVTDPWDDRPQLLCMRRPV